MIKFVSRKEWDDLQTLHTELWKCLAETLSVVKEMNRVAGKRDLKIAQLERNLNTVTALLSQTDSAVIETIFESPPIPPNNL